MYFLECLYLCKHIKSERGVYNRRVGLRDIENHIIVVYLNLRGFG
jgi:hypothetical protein